MIESIKFTKRTKEEKKRPLVLRVKKDGVVTKEIYLNPFRKKNS